jgi:GNAT superfamily N-acetyltransferase
VPERFRTGVGTELIEAAHERLGDGVALWVLDGNEAALRFYARHGYAPDGATTTHEPTGLEELRLTRQTRE